MEFIVGIALALFVCGATHGVMDFFHHDLVQNTGVPQGWPGFCMTCDVTAAAYVAVHMAVRAGSKRKLRNLGAS